MNGNQHVDGDDYTWDGTPSARAVLNPALLPSWAAAWQRGEFVALDAPALKGLADLAAYDQAGPDLRTADQKEQDDVTELYRLWKVLHSELRQIDRRLEALIRVLEVRL